MDITSKASLFTIILFITHLGTVSPQQQIDWESIERLPLVAKLVTLQAEYARNGHQVIDRFPVEETGISEREMLRLIREEALSMRVEVT